jgi:hypothetical protein
MRDASFPGALRRLDPVLDELLGLLALFRGQNLAERLQFRLEKLPALRGDVLELVGSAESRAGTAAPRAAFGPDELGVVVDVILLLAVVRQDGEDLLLDVRLDELALDLLNRQPERPRPAPAVRLIQSPSDATWTYSRNRGKDCHPSGSDRERGG